MSGEFGDVKGEGEAVGANVGEEEGEGGGVVGVDDGGAGGGGRSPVVDDSGIVETGIVVAALEEGVEGAEGGVGGAAGDGDGGRGGGAEKMVEAGDVLDEVFGDGEGAAGEVELDVFGFSEFVIFATTWFWSRSFGFDQV